MAETLPNTDLYIATRSHRTMRLGPSLRSVVFNLALRGIYRLAERLVNYAGPMAALVKALVVLGLLGIISSWFLVYTIALNLTFVIGPPFNSLLLLLVFGYIAACMSLIYAIGKASLSGKSEEDSEPKRAAEMLYRA